MIYNVIQHDLRSLPIMEDNPNHIKMYEFGMNQLSQFIINHWPLWLAFIILILLVFTNELFSQKKKAKEKKPDFRYYPF